jgi:non-homologous end joining protein Ku
LEPRGRGLLGVTLRYPYEVRNEADYFDDIPDEKLTPNPVHVALHTSPAVPAKKKIRKRPAVASAAPPLTSAR